MNKSISVLKFGGTSVGSGERIRSVAHILAHTARNSGAAFPVGVISAMAGVTDQLLRVAYSSYTGSYTACEDELRALEQRHFEAAEEVVQSKHERDALQDDLAMAFRALRQDVAALRFAAKEDLSLLTTAVAAWGERLSILLVAAALRDSGVQAIAVRDEMIITGPPQDEVMPMFADLEVPFSITRADPLAGETRASVEAHLHPLIERGIVPIVAGFIGRTTTGYVTTLGRNGSDYSASVIGAALDCVEVSLYTDVDGILTADPRVVANTRLLPQLSYGEAMRLSEFGAKVLHPRTLLPLVTRNIPVRVRNTFRPHTPGTLVGPGELSGAKAITARHHLALLTIERTDVLGSSEDAAKILALIARAGGASVALCLSASSALAFLIEEHSAAALATLLLEQLNPTSWRLVCRRNLAVCACIGSGFPVDPKSAARAITALVHERIPVITQSASELGILLVVEERDSEAAVRCLHRDLIAPVIPLVRHPMQERLHRPPDAAAERVLPSSFPERG